MKRFNTSPLAFCAALFGVAALLYRPSTFTWNTTQADVEGDLIGNDGEKPPLASPEVKILSFDPFIAHIRDFITPSERQYLKNFSKPMLSRSTVQYQNGSQMESQERTSSTAYLPLGDPVVGRISRRAGQFQGYIPIKDIQVTSYQEGQQYVPHYDWFTEPDRSTNRLSTFFAILEADCEKCGTQFPRLSFNWAERDPRLCELVDCSQEILTTRNIEGSAIYWRNLDAAGRGRWDTLHAGLPALNGTKIELNIWTEIDVTPQSESADS